MNKWLYTLLCLLTEIKQANAYVPGWGQTIFQSANEMMNNDIYRKRMDDQQKKLEEERQWWSKKKTSIQEGFMKELNEGSTASTEEARSTNTITKSVEAPPTISTAGTSVQGSDDDAVLVEAETSSNTPASPPSVKKKAKGKK
jgi:Preprotein translocase subunit Sec66